MWKVFKDNFIKLYMGAFLPVIFMLFLQITFEEYCRVNLILASIYFIIDCGWYWFVLEISRGKEKAFETFINAFKSAGWLIIMRTITTIIFIIIGIVCTIILSYFSDNISLLIIAIFVFMVFPYALFAFTDFIYYDEKDLGILNAIFKSIAITKQVYLKVFTAYILKTVIFYIAFFDIITFPIHNAFVRRSVCFMWNFMFYPVFTLWIYKLYDKIALTDKTL